MWQVYPLKVARVKISEETSGNEADPNSDLHGESGSGSYVTVLLR
jgi:hypothetical protein